MKIKTKAALLSGLVFPGLGHLLLKKYLRGSILVLSTLTAVSVIVSVSVKRAMAIVDDITRGNIPADAGSIMELISESNMGADNSAINYAWIVIAACWLFGIIDSYRIGSKTIVPDQSSGPKA